MMIKRRKTRRIFVGNVPVGGSAPVSVQSMTDTDTRDVGATVGRIRSLAREGCEIVRVAVPDETAAQAFRKIKAASPIPVIADIHFDHRLAIECAFAGADGLRINPGNIGGEENTLRVIQAALEARIPIRIGVNSGSLEKDLLRKHGGPTAGALAESAARWARFCEKARFTKLKFSLKASDVPTTVEACRIFSKRFDYPLHIGVTESGPPLSGAVKSSVGLGILLSEGIGDTLRVSLTGPPEDEVRVGWRILSCLGLRRRGPDFISCPTCGRVSIDVAGIAGEIEKRLSGIQAHMKVAIMGCAVNGPGEAREADIGVAGGKKEGLIFVKGEVVKKVKEQDIVGEVVRLAERLARSHAGRAIKGRKKP